MAELDVQPKKKSPWWIWLILALVILALIFLIRGCNKDEVADTEVVTEDSSAKIEAVTVPNWSNVDFDAPNASIEEITDTSITVRGNDNYTIYGLGENILFATDDSNIQSGAEKQLEQISASLKKRFNGGAVAVYGNTDSTGTAGHNAELGKQRAESVKNWLVKNAGVSSNKISVESKGQSDPVATNATSEGRQMNRRVEIVVMKQ
jgi:outer membrane protein OmpA-like peptidoglycan-associated protein